MVTDEELTRYLLGGLGKRRRLAIEEAYLGDAALFERLEIAEDKLVDDYLTHRLWLLDRIRFRRHYLASPPHREKLRMAHRLVQALAPESLAPARRPSRPALTLAFASVVVGVGAVVWWAELLHQKSAEQIQALQKRNGELERSLQVATARLAEPPVVSLLLLAGTDRLFEEESRIELPPDGATVLLKAKVDASAPTSFLFTLTRLDGAQVSGDELTRTGDVAQVSIPAVRLPSGEYLLRLRGAGSAWEKTYQFRAVRTGAGR